MPPCWKPAFKEKCTFETQTVKFNFQVKPKLSKEDLTEEEINTVEEKEADPPKQEKVELEDPIIQDDLWKRKKSWLQDRSQPKTEIATEKDKSDTR